jgi:hypothetical protein
MGSVLGRLQGLTWQRRVKVGGVSCYLFSRHKAGPPKGASLTQEHAHGEQPAERSGGGQTMLTPQGLGCVCVCVRVRVCVRVCACVCVCTARRGGRPRAAVRARGRLHRAPLPARHAGAGAVGQGHRGVCVHHSGPSPDRGVHAIRTYTPSSATWWWCRSTRCCRRASTPSPGTRCWPSTRRCCRWVGTTQQQASQQHAHSRSDTPPP